MPPETFEEFYGDITELANNTPELPALKGFHKSYIKGSSAAGIEVASKKEGKSSLVPRTLFMALWNALNTGEELNKEQLEEDYNLTRLSFLMALVAKLDYVRYQESSESIKLEK